MYATHVLEAAKYDTPRLDGFRILQEFGNVLPDEIPRLPPKRDINFTFDLMQGKAPVSKTPYRVSMPDLLELKMQVKELWRAPV